MAPRGERELGVVVFGATGVTGRRVGAYLAQRAGEAGLRWAAAGRDARRVEQVLGELGVVAPETIAADVGDSASLRAMAARTRVLLNLVGPYTVHGPPVVEACVASGTHYVDLAGELPFVRRTIDAVDARAAAAAVKVVQTCGFEALPPDLCVRLAAEAARERWGEDLDDVEATVSMQRPPGRLGLSDLVSGGTLQSMAEALAGENAALAGDPALLITDPELAGEVRRASPISLAPRFGASGELIGPVTPGAFINPAVVHRSAALCAAERGERPRPFRYREGVPKPGGAATLPFRYAGAALSGASQTGLRALAHAPRALRAPVAGAMRRAFPRSGFGPSGGLLERWSWRLELEARTAAGRQVRVDADADGHPGYLTTARIIGEAGLILAEPGAAPARGGCLTPATALGTACVERFGRAGARFAVMPDSSPRPGRGG